MRLLTQVTERFLVIFGLLGVTDRGLLGMSLLRLWLGTIFSMAMRPVSVSRVAGASREFAFVVPLLAGCACWRRLVSDFL